jgi:hypothetical protein
MTFHAGCFKNPQYIPIVDKLHKINWVLFTGGMRLGCEAEKFKNTWSYTSTLPYLSLDRYFTKRSDKPIKQEYPYFRTVNVSKMEEIAELSHVLSCR